MAEINVKTYIIGGKRYEQRPLVLGQLRQLEQLAADIPWQQEMSAEALLNLLADRLPRAAAVVLRPQRPWPLRLLYEPRRKNLQRLAARLADDLDLVTVCQVFRDFFICNPVQSLFQGLAGVLPQTAATAAASTASASTSPPATSPDVTPFCGDTPLPSAGPGLSTAPAR